jgi:heme-degrading monooxygenase HmoA
MPTLPWTPLARADPSEEHVVVASRFGLTSRLHTGRIFSAAQALVSTFPTTPGLIGHSLRAGVVGSSLWTLSAWRTESEMREGGSSAQHPAP